MDAENPLASPFCAHLRSKKYYFQDAAPRTNEDILDASNWCWCAKTCTFLGPDDDVVHPDACRAGRACFRALFTPAQPEVEA